MELLIPLEDAPDWLVGILVKADPATGELVFTIQKRSGGDYGYFRLASPRFDAIRDLLQ